MGLDIVLGILVVAAAIRGWIQGFVHQAIRIGGLVACIYLAAPVRDSTKPYILPYLPAIQPDVVDRLLWWVSAPLSYAVLVGIATLLIRMTRRPEIPGLREVKRNDQFAGFLLGASKGLLIAVFVAAGIQRYAVKQITTITWAEDQVKASWALRWNEQYHPASRIWSAPPVRHLVNHIERMGLQSPSEAAQSGANDASGGHTSVETARRSSGADAEHNTASGERPSDSTSRPAGGSSPTGLDREVEKAVEDIKATLDAASKPSNWR
jgi:uncharacterized membrane protein required for colicin V production